jgi:hypothetical protein
MPTPSCDCDYLRDVWTSDPVQQKLLNKMHSQYTEEDFRRFCIQLKAHGGFKGALHDGSWETLIQEAQARNDARMQSGMRATASAAADASGSTDNQHGATRTMPPCRWCEGSSKS